MKQELKNIVRKRRYKVRFIKEGERKIRYLDYVWARSAREAKQIVMAKRRTEEKILKVRAGALG